MVPDVEIAESANGEEEETAIGRDTWQDSTLIEGCGIEHQFARTELVGLGIKGLTIDVIFQFLNTKEGFHSFRNGGIPTVEMGTTIVEHLAIGCPAWEHLVFGGMT